MITEKMLKALNDQITLEFNSAYLYLGMAAHFDNENLPGFAAWMKAQFGEEQMHATKLFEYVSHRGGAIKLGPLDAPKCSYGSPSEVFTSVLAHEQKVTASIHSLYELAQNQKDYATQSQLNWFIDEQVEEEKTAGDILEQLKVVEAHPHLLLGLDRRIMAARSAGAE